MKQILLSNNYEIKSLGVCELDVYDIEVEDNHNFFGNDILVHNSSYLNLEKVYNHFNFQNVDDLDKYVKDKVEPFIHESFKHMYEYMNHYDFQIVMKRECIADKGLFLNKKKRYALNVIDNEGVRYAEPELKIMGLEVIKSSTPAGIKPYLENIIKIILNNDKSKLIEYMDEVRTKFYNMPPEDICIPKSVSYIDKYLNISDEVQYDEEGNKKRKLSMPINTRAAVNYNKLIKERKLDKKYTLIDEGSKMKYIFLNPQNPTGENVIGFINNLPKELEMEKYIDYDLQFEKVFIDNVRNIIDDLNWNLNTRYTIDDLL